MKKHIFLLEIGTEELPSKILYKLGESFAKKIQNGFKKFNISYQNIFWFASSRRLAVKVIDLLINLEVITSCSNDDLYVKYFDEYIARFGGCFLNDKNITLLLNRIINFSVEKFTIPVTMKWNDKNIKFVRPVRTLTMLLDENIVISNLFGIFTDRIVRGHRFMGAKKIAINHADNYEKLLFKNGFVMVDYKRRKETIRDSVQNIAKEIGGFVDYTDHFLEEVTGLSEWPVVLFGSFKKEFLFLPYEILLYIMIVKKKYFPVYDLNKKLLPYFIFVVDVVIDNPERVVVAHEKVLYSYFFDANFFLNCDKKYRLEDYLSQLHTVLFHKELGNLYDKTIRIKILSVWMAYRIGIDTYQVERAAILSKCDLLSNMVREFPFSQGIIGMYYARRDGELEEVALAQKEQYQPRFSSDILPSTLISCVLSISDKIDTIVGMFLIGQEPKGSGDPMGIRRASIGILRILIEKKIKISLWDLLEESLKLYENFLIEGYAKRIIRFMYRRLCVLYEKNGYSIHIIQATLSEKLINLLDFNERVNAVSLFFELEESKLLFMMYKRIFNILRNVSKPFECDFIDSLFIEKAEVDVAEKIIFLRKEFISLCDMDRYYDALILLLTLCIPVENFFKNVIVMSENKFLQLNRLKMLNEIWCLLTRIMNTPHRIFDIHIYTNKRPKSL